MHAKSLSFSPYNHTIHPIQGVLQVTFDRVYRVSRRNRRESSAAGDRSVANVCLLWSTASILLAVIFGEW